MSNNNNNNNNKSENKSDNKPVNKKESNVYVSLILYAILGLALGYAVAKGVMYLVNKTDNNKVANIIKNISDKKEGSKDGDDKMTKEIKDVMQNVGTSSFKSSVSTQFEGKRSAEITFDHNNNLTVTQGIDNKSKYFYITDASKNTIATVYMSYEGGRGYTSAEYAKVYPLLKL